jgi:hypothetical protein
VPKRGLLHPKALRVRPENPETLPAAARAALGHRPSVITERSATLEIDIASQVMARL